MSEWISVEDELPDGCTTVIAVRNKNMPFMARFYGASFIAIEDLSKVKPTHWMPLPEPPK